MYTYVCMFVYTDVEFKGWPGGEPGGARQGCKLMSVSRVCVCVCVCTERMRTI